MNTDDLTGWLRGSGLEIILTVLGAVLLTRFVRWCSDRLIMRSDARIAGEEQSQFAAVEENKRRQSVVQVITWVSTVSIGFVAGLLIVEKFNVPLTSIVAPATVLGAALGFGSQRVVQDLLSGFFLFTERQYGVGDVIKISPPGTEAGITGTVEEVTLRSTRVRTVNGEVVILPNGEIRQVTNLSRNWARVVLDIPLRIDVDLDEVSTVLHSLGEAMKQDQVWSARLLSNPEVWGIEKFGAGFLELRLVARTLPGAQWDVARELRRRILTAFREADIQVEESFGKDLV